ncbi:MAG: hypothetical protein JXA11_02045 [Phycisphaerae bacterium]|nr:hypothetical protein [Phycisphaerae bacterium]
MKPFIFISLLFFASFFVGCTSESAGTMSTQSRPSSYWQQKSGGYTDDGGSLFAGDGKILSDKEIERILAFEFQPRKLNRIAIMPFGQNRCYGWSDELDKTALAVQNVLIGKLKALDSVYDASYLPSLLVPPKKTVGHLREAAARYQADLLLIYKTSFNTYEKYQLFKPDQSKAYCTVEAVLLDTRTGIVPFTVLTTQTYTAEKQSDDMSFYETIRKAELKALQSALSEIGDRVTQFMSKTKD